MEPVALRVLVGAHWVRKLADAAWQVGQEPAQLAAARPQVGAKLRGVRDPGEQAERLGERPVGRAHDRVACP